MKDCMNFQRGDIVKLTVNKKTVENSSDVNIQDYVEYIGIVNKLENGMLSFCVTMETQTGLLHFANENNKEHINFGLDKIIDANLFTIKNEIEYFYRGIFKYYTVEGDPNWFEYFTDSTYYENEDWFAHMCGVEMDDDGGYDNFVYDYSQYIWSYLMENFTEKPKEKNKMISLDKACKWLLNIDYDSLRYRDFGEEFNEELFVSDFKKAMEE